MKRISLLFLLVSFLTVTTAFADKHNDNSKKYDLKNDQRVATLPALFERVRPTKEYTIIKIGTPAAGADMWTAAIADLFIPHKNNCDPLTETFVEVFPGEGLCIEIDERPAQEWVEARHTCIQEGKRLPELGELQYICKHNDQYGIQGAESSGEWSSNFLLIGDDASRTAKVTVAMFGSGSCNDISAGLVSRDGFGNNPNSFPFRCVR